MRSLWMDPDEVRHGPLQERISVDVAIVGGGLSGVGAAFGLRESGLAVALLEARSIASGATGRNAGFLLAGPSMDYLDAAHAIGFQATDQIWHFTQENGALIAQLIEELSIDCGFLRRGSMSLAASVSEWEALSATAQALHDHGILSCLVEAAQLPVPFNRLYSGGIYYAGNGEMNAAAFVRGVAASLPARIFERTPVRRLTFDGRWQLLTDGGGVTAQRVILATNAYTARLLDVPIRPVRGQVLATASLPYVTIPFPMYANYGYEYWRQTVDGRLVVGGWRNLDIPGEVGQEEVLNQHIQGELEAFVHQVAPGATVIERWAGIMGFSPDGFPLVGAVPERAGLFLAAGYTGHGVAMAFLCGARVAGRAVGYDTEIPVAFDPARYALSVPSGYVAPTDGNSLETGS